MDTLSTVALAKYDETAYAESLSIYNLLSTLAPDNFDHWFRVGITAQKCENYDLALKAYGITTYFVPERLESRIFSSECYLAQGHMADAEAEYEEARIIMDALPMEERNKDQIELLTHLEMLIKNYSFA